jgi:diadenosine tetraphosphatase ApaH/serine/threonine PP2A family protein phosphatase
VGYGPQPSRCCELVAAHADVSLVGNHDLAVLGRLDLEDFSPEAADSIRSTAERISSEALVYLAGLHPCQDTGRAALYHASPRDPVWEYVLSAEAARAALALASRPLVLVGHSHVALRMALGGSPAEIEGGLARGGSEVLLSQTPLLLNPGSIGQPRDGDPRAAWLLLDFERERGWFRRTPYEIERTQEEMREAGLAESLAERLASGT